MRAKGLRETQLKEIITLKYGKGLPERQRENGPYPIYGSGGVVGYHKEWLIKGPGIIVGRKGSIGTIYFESKNFYPIDTVFYVELLSDETNLKFIYYLLQQMNFKSLNSDAAVPGLNRDVAMKQLCYVPPLPTQREIAAILSAYDDLIENNTRRIAILEEMAQALYREWFVHFRFPGSEKKSMVESALGMIPEGWEVKSFAEVAEFINGYAFKPEDWGKVGKPIVKIAELKNGVADKTPFHDGSIPSKYHIQSGDLLFSWSADLDVYVWSGGPALLNQHLFNVVPYEGFTKVFLFFSLKERMWDFRSKSQGTTMKHIKRAALEQVYFWVPPVETRLNFEEKVQPILANVQNLTEKNATLRRTRDLLLPKLIAGELDVEGMAIALGGDGVGDDEGAGVREEEGVMS